MNTTKLRIDLSNGQLEIEGDKDLVRAVYDDFKDQMVTNGATKASARWTAKRAAGRKRAHKLSGPSPQKHGRKAATKNGRQRRSHEEAAAMRKEIKAALKSGATAAELADKYGVSRSYVYQQK